MNKIMYNLNHAGSFYKFNGIVSCVNLKDVSTEIIDRLKILKNDNSQIAGHKISDFSIAALDILGVEKYKDNDESIINLIESKLRF